MIEYDIYITIQEIQDKVLHETTVLAKTKEPQYFNQIVFDEDNQQLFMLYYQEGIDNIIDKLSAYLKKNWEENILNNSENQNPLITHISLQLPDTFIPNKGIDTSIQSYLIYYITYCWLALKLPQESGAYLLRAKENIDKLNFRIEQRTQNRKRPYRLF